MAYFNDKFKKARLDQSPYLFHFINGYDKSPCETLQKILAEKQLFSKKGYICFSASPLTAIQRFFEVKVNSTGQPLYQTWGLGFSRDILVRDFGARNVIYTDGKEGIPGHLDWRTQELKIDSYDYEYLREWRIKGEIFDFSDFPQGEIIVIAPNQDALNYLCVKFDMEFTGIVNYYTGDVEEDWSEVWKREWKGISVDKLESNLIDDFALSGSTISQVIGEDMVDKLLEASPLKLLTSNKKK